MADNQSVVSTFLAVAIGSSQIRWGIFDREQESCRQLNTFKALEGQPRDELIAKWSDSLENDLKSVAKVSVAFLDTPFELVPDALYTSELEPHLLQLKVSKSAHSLGRQSVAAMHANAVYGLDERWISAVRKVFPAADISLQAANLIAGILAQCSSLSPARLWIHQAPESIVVFASEGKEIHFAHAFDVKTASDLLYYTQLVVEQLGWQEKISRITHFGGFDKRLEELAKYYQLEANYGLSFQKLADGLSAKNKSEYVDLFNQFKCAL